MQPWLGQTNHKLYQARLVLDKARQCSDDAVLQDALETSALYLTHDAYISYLNELYELAGGSSMVSSLDEAMEQTRLIIGEMRELDSLRRDSFGWLATLLRQVEECRRPQQSKPRATERAPAKLIALAAVSDNTERGEEIAGWRQSLSDLIDRQRENRQES
jgi:hypothetical protein